MQFGRLTHVNNTDFLFSRVKHNFRYTGKNLFCVWMKLNIVGQSSISLPNLLAILKAMYTEEQPPTGYSQQLLLTVS